MPSIRHAFERVATETLEIADSASLAIEQFTKCVDMPPSVRLLAIQDLQAEIQAGRLRALELSRILPSPNGVPPALAQNVATIAKALFNFVRLCDTRQRVLLTLQQNLSRQPTVVQ